MLQFDPNVFLGGGIWEGVLGSLPSEWSNLLFMCASWLSIKALEQHPTDRYFFEAELKKRLGTQPFQFTSGAAQPVGQAAHSISLLSSGESMARKKVEVHGSPCMLSSPKGQGFICTPAHCLEKVHCVWNLVSRFFSDSNYCYNWREKPIYQPIV